MSLSDHPRFQNLEPADREAIQDWYAKRYLATRDLGRRKIKTVKAYQLPMPKPWPRRSPVLETHPNLRRQRVQEPAYRASVKRPGSGGYR